MSLVLVRHRRYATLATTSLVLVAALSGPVHASFIFGYTPSAPSPNNPGGPPVYDPRFDRFSTNFPTEVPLANALASFVSSGFDLSGVGWLTSTPSLNFAMISPRHFVAAAHNGLATFTNGASVSFFTGTGTTSTVVTRTVASSVRVPSQPGSPNPVSEILLGTLTADVPSGVAFYPVPVGLRGQFLGGRVYVYDQEHRVGTNNIDGFENNVNIDSPGAPPNSTNLVGYDFNMSGPPGEIVFTSGDSGGPTFLNVNGQFAYLGPHLALSDQMTPVISLDGFVPDYVAQINALMLPSGLFVTTVPVPEPGSLALTATAIGLALGARRIRRPRPDRR